MGWVHEARYSIERRTLWCVFGGCVRVCHRTRSTGSIHFSHIHVLMGVCVFELVSYILAFAFATINPV